MPKRVQENVNPLAFFRKGESFLYAAKFLNTQPTSVSAQAVFALVTCTAFAAEVYLKVLAIIETGLPRPLETHHLRHLFNELSSDSQEIIKREWTEKCLPGVRGDGVIGEVPDALKKDRPSNFDQALDKSARAFVDWRYFYSEDVALNFHMLGLPPIVRKIILEKNPEFRSRLRLDRLHPDARLREAEGDGFTRSSPFAPVLNDEGALVYLKPLTRPTPDDGGATKA